MVANREVLPRTSRGCVNRITSRALKIANSCSRAVNRAQSARGRAGRRGRPLCRGL